MIYFILSFLFLCFIASFCYFFYKFNLLNDEINNLYDDYGDLLEKASQSKDFSNKVLDDVIVPDKVLDFKKSTSTVQEEEKNIERSTKHVNSVLRYY